MKKKLLSALLSLAMVITMMPAMTMTAFAKGYGPWGMLAEAMSGNIPDGNYSESFSVSSSDGTNTITLLSDIKKSKGDEIYLKVKSSADGGKKIVLDLNGHVLDRGLISADGTPTKHNDGSVIYVESGAELKITDNSPDTVHKFREITTGDYKGLWVLDNSGTKTIKGGVITGGTGTFMYTDTYYAGGIYSEYGKLTMTKGTICGNMASRCGGGAYVGDANLDGVTICGNLLTDNSGSDGGGGVYIFGVSSKNCNLKNCKIVNNASRNEAGGIDIGSDAVAKISGCDISNNIAKHTGGIDTDDGADCEIANTTIKNNSANDSAGGVSLYYTASLTIGGKMIIRSNETTEEDYGIEENNLCIPNVEGHVGSIKISTQTPLSTGSDIGVTVNVFDPDTWAAGTVVDSFFGDPTTLKDSNYRYFVMNNNGDVNTGTLFYITKSGSNYVLAGSKDPDPDPGSGGGGGGSSDEETGEEYTVGGNGLEIKATIESGIAKIDDIQKDALKKFEDNVKENSKIDSIELDFIKAGQGVKGAEFTKPTLENVQDILESKQNNVSKLVVKMSEGTVSLDARALDAVTDQANGDTIILVVDKTQNTQLTTKKQETLKEYNVNKTFEAFFESNGQRIHDFKGGVATVSMKFEPDQGSNTKNYKIYYLDDNAKMHKYATKYEGGMLVFATTHFSDYVIVYDGKTDVLLLKANASGKKIKLSWNKLDNITKYVVYSSRCGKKYKKIKTFKGNKLAIKRASGKKLKKHRAYKFYVVAYDAVGNKVMSRNIHTIYGISHGKHANVRSVKVKNKSVTLKAGSSTSMGAKYKVYGHKRHVTRSHGVFLKYFTNNPEVAKVSSSGKITAVGKGTATIYVQDVGGKYNTTKVTVK